MTRLVLIVVAAAVLLGAVATAGYLAGRPGPAAATTVWSTGPTVTHIESLGHLVATRVHVSDVLKAEGKGYRGSWLVKGDALISIDLGRARVADVDRQRRTARVVLPPPRVLQARVDHERTKTWNVEKTTWVPWGGDGDALRDDAMYHAQKLVEFAAASGEHARQAMATAETVVVGVYRMIDWTITVEWEAPRPAPGAVGTDRADERPPVGTGP